MFIPFNDDCPKLKYFCPYKSKLTTTSFNVNRCTLCTVQAHANARGNCNLCISGEDCLSGLSLILANTGRIGTALFSLAYQSVHFPIALAPALGSSNFI